MADAFKQSMSVTIISAWDGGTVYDFWRKRLMRGGSDSGDWRKDIEGQGTWYMYVDKYNDGAPKRRRIGRVVTIELQ